MPMGDDSARGRNRTSLPCRDSCAACSSRILAARLPLSTRRYSLCLSSVSTVLVVDDEAAIREVAHRVLTSAGYQVETAATGHEALGLLADPELTADLILTDIVMPGMTGAALAAQARAIRRGLPVLFMSGYEQQGATAEGWPDPAAQIIGKPFSRAALLARVTQMLTADADASASELPGQRVRSERSQQGHRTLAERW